MNTKRVLTTRITINNILVGLLFCSSWVVDSIADWLTIPNLYAFFCFAIGILFVINNRFNIAIQYALLAFLGVLFLQSLIGYYTIGNVSASQFFLCFLAIGILSSVCGCQKLEARLICRTVVWMGLLTVRHAFIIIQEGSFAYISGVQMGIAYGCLPIIVASIVLLTTKEEYLRYKLLSVALIVLELNVLFRQMTRGVLVCLLLFILLYFLIISRQSVRIKVIVGSLFVVGLVIYLVFLRQWLESTRWYYVIFVQKSRDVLNGRGDDYLLVLSWRGIRSFLIGSGCGSFQRTVRDIGVSYPHNLLLQMYYEQGVFVMLAMLSIIINSIVLLTKKTIDNSQKTILAFMLAVSIMRLMVSYYFWIDSVFWIYTANVFYLSNQQRKQKKARILQEGVAKDNTIRMEQEYIPE